ncbi:hypothetical protein [Pseudoduganella armeniaca]|uniref:Uncharacterized protein n=1 Tax=Pseudoduganella armeniaca TaxID=2072590 RepID=A0A2R4C9P9_9BURK|nr:hypothetical protein [Pseudoduganella armeniaca]AVR96337.1 hypothetical protein C9I28_11925 [Pseudoduganella armeniaca]
MMRNPELNLHAAANERLDLAVTSDLATQFRPELFAMLRPLHLSHLVEELWAPLCAGGNTLTAVALEERPWPPKGVGGTCPAIGWRRRCVAARGWLRSTAPSLPRWRACRSGIGRQSRAAGRSKLISRSGRRGLGRDPRAFGARLGG